MRLSDVQEKALDLSRHVAITAAAGSGKTTVLIERFLRILESNGFKPEEIVAITFTEEAAAQVKEGIRQAMEERMAAADSSDDRWERVYPLLSLAKITTIHGFCMSMLREYPLEVGLDPGFTVLSPGEQKLRLVECVAETLQELSRRFDAQLEILLDYLPRVSLDGLLTEMVERRSFLRHFVTGRADRPSWFGPLEQVYRRETEQMLLKEQSWKALETLLSRPARELLEAVNSCSQRCRRQQELFENRSRFSPEEFLERFRETLWTRVSPSRQWKESGQYERLKQLWDSLRDQFKRHPLDLGAAAEGDRRQVDRHFTRAGAALRAVYARVLDRYEREKRSDAVLDFEDLLILARRLLGHGRVRRALRERYRFFLVDEFQDTNYLQWEILEKLIGPGTNFFAVGDAKQSIYRFRDADVTVFRELQDWIREEGAVIDMVTNYRSVPGLIEFNNRVFSALFKAGLPYEAVHQEMEPCREAGPDSAGPWVEAFFYEDPPEDELFFEPGVTARWVTQLVQEQGWRYADVAILLRARTRLKEYEEALRRAGVPFQTVGGIGFFERQEVLDLVNLLRFLSHPRNDVALLGVLRSPFFSLSDEDLFLLSLQPGSTYWKKLQEAGTWPFAGERLRAWLSDSHGDTIAGFLRRALGETGYLEVISASPRAAQSTRNVRKFLDLVRSFEKERSRSFPEFLRFVDAMVRGEPREAEAPLLEDLGNVVKIYTIHGAKGLQFPVVILPDLGAPLLTGRRNRFYFHTWREGSRRQTFLSPKFWNPDQHEGKGYAELEHPVYRMLERLDEYRQIAEEKRLLYVALTRARDRLVLIGRLGQSLSYARWLNEVRPQDIHTVAPPLPAAPPKITRFFRVQERVPAEPAPVPIEKQVWTPTELALFSRCPYKYYLSGIEAVPEGAPLSWKRVEKKEALVGSAVHEMLERPLEDAALLDRRLQLWRQRHQRLFAEEELTHIEERIRRQLERIAAHPFYERLARAVQLYSERPFHFREGDLLITGVIDKLFQEKDGRWVVVDFKTHEIPASEVTAKIGQEAYDLQVEIYLWVVSRILAAARLEGFLFFTYSGEVVPVHFGPPVVEKCEKLMARLPRRVGASVFPKTTEVGYCYACGYYREDLCSGAPGAGRRPEQKSLW